MAITRAGRKSSQARLPWWRIALRLAKWLGISVEIVFLVLAVTCLGAAYGAWRSVADVLPKEADLAGYEPPSSTKIYAANGELLATLTLEENSYDEREIVDIADLPQYVKLATIAIEDERFYEHRGVDLRAIIRAAKADIQSRSMTQGASTITQQLARSIYLSQRKVGGRKVQEMALAIEIERRYSKEEILEMYLNQVFYGSGAYGIEAAAKTYFRKSAKDLKLHEAALLAALPNNPSRWSPYTNPEGAKARRNLVLEKMAQLGFISREQAEKAEKMPLKVAPRPVRGLMSYKAPYFTTYCIRELERRYGRDLVWGGGLRVYTTLNLALQEHAQRELIKGVERNRRIRASQGATVLMDPRNGKILAMVGGLGFSEKDQYNRAWQAKRPPGSAFKPFVYTTAIAMGYSPATVVSGAPVEFRLASGRWKPRGGGGGSYTLATALAISHNIITCKLIYRIGPEAVVRMAKRMGIKSDIRPFLSIALGTECVSPLELLTAFCCFANGGLRVEPTTIERVTDRNGVVIDDSLPERKRVLTKRTAYIMNRMLAGVIKFGTGTRAQGLGVPTIGKTGTTEYAMDTWFVGLTPKLACVVWIGNDDNTPMLGRAYGGTVAAPIWKSIMAKALDLANARGGQFPGPGSEIHLPKIAFREIPSAEEEEEEKPPDYLRSERDLIELIPGERRPAAADEGPYGPPPEPVGGPPQPVRDLVPLTPGEG